MSHFVVMVIGDNLDDQLQPFDENIVVDEYKKRINLDEWWFLRSKERDGVDKTDLVALCEMYNTDVYGEDGPPEDDSERLLIDEEGLYELSTYSPLSKWDWWTLGGRWSGSLTTKAGEQTDQARKGNIDWVAMAEKRKAHAMETWTEYQEKLKTEPNAERLGSLIYGVEEGDTLETYVGRSENFSVFAMLVNGEWCERGKMGWWGAVSNESDKEKWAQFTQDTIDQLSDDTLISMVDCHI